MAIAFPDQVFKIFIRDITSERLQDMVSKMDIAPQSRSFINMAAQVYGRMPNSTPSEPTPGGPTPPPTEPPATTKNPLEIWQDRVEDCRRKLPEGLLTFFTEAESLEKCPTVKNMFRQYEQLANC